jgi:hypothetical protein
MHTVVQEETPSMVWGQIALDLQLNYLHIRRITGRVRVRTRTGCQHIITFLQNVTLFEPLKPTSDCSQHLNDIANQREWVAGS